jgi:hypothetical protein
MVWLLELDRELQPRPWHTVQLSTALLMMQVQGDRVSGDGPRAPR